jgi:glycine oxidase
MLKSMGPQQSFDIIVLGAGVVGLATALELSRRGAKVLLLERDRPLTQASSAAAGMLAVADPHNPGSLLPLSRYSASLYPAFLQRIQALSSLPVPIQTQRTLQTFDDGHQELLHEHSLDPRMLGIALLEAVHRSNITLRNHAEFRYVRELPRGEQAVLLNGERIHAKRFLLATGAWGLPEPMRSPLGYTQPNPIAPSKGQMLRVALPPSLLGLDTVHRRGSLYIVPRTQGPQAGSALLGATVEDAGFDTTVHAEDLAALRAQAAELLPAFAGESLSPTLESWAGLRPATADGLPLLGNLYPDGPLCALGAGRNGILLTPAIAAITADILEGKPAAVDLTPFAPQRLPLFKQSAAHAGLPK